MSFETIMWVEAGAALGLLLFGAILWVVSRYL